MTVRCEAESFEGVILQRNWRLVAQYVNQLINQLHIQVLPALSSFWPYPASKSFEVLIPKGWHDCRMIIVVMWRTPKGWYTCFIESYHSKRYLSSLSTANFLIYQEFFLIRFRYIMLLLVEHIMTFSSIKIHIRSESRLLSMVRQAQHNSRVSGLALRRRYPTWYLKVISTTR